jgi:hypothetical protein
VSRRLLSITHKIHLTHSLTHCAREKAGIAGNVLEDPAIRWEIYTTVMICEKREDC